MTPLNAERAYCARGWSWAGARQRQKDYLRLKFDVFIDEWGFSRVPSRHGLAQPDAFDCAGWFVIAETRAGEAVGIGRLNCPDDADMLPTADAFPELTAGPLVRLKPPLRVALLPHYRGIFVNAISEQCANSRISGPLRQRGIAAFRRGLWPAHAPGA